MMQLLYANDGINYRTISKSVELTSGIEQALLQTYLNYDFIVNSSNYSSIEQEPETITYTVSNLNNELPENYLIVTKAGHMSKIATPSYYFHALIEKVDDDFFKEDFFRIFNYEFVKDQDISQYNHQSIDNFHFTNNNIHQVLLSKEQIVYILAMFMDNEKNNLKTKIIVDVNGDDYNQRSREILAAIYYYLPYGLRKRYGFSTYQRQEITSGKISFVLYPKEEIKNINETYIDLNQIDYQALSAKINRQFLDYANYLVNGLDDVQRKKHFEKLSQIANHGRLKIDDCVTYYNNLNKWTKGHQEELLPEWINYVDQNGFRKGPLFEMMLEIIKSKIDNQYYNDYLINQVLKVHQEKLSELSLMAAKTIRFAGYFEHLKINQEQFINWYFESGNLKELDKTNSVQEIIENTKVIADEIERLQQVDIGSKQLLEIIDLIVNKLTDLLEENKQQLEGHILTEGDRIGQLLAKTTTMNVSEFSNKIKEIESQIVFEENQEILRLAIIEWLEKYLSTQATKKDLMAAKEFVNDIQATLSNDDYQTIMQQIDMKLTAMAKQKQRLNYQITDLSSVLNNYLLLTDYLNNGMFNDDDQVNVLFDNFNVEMEVRILKRLLEYLLIADQYEESFNQYLDRLFELKLLTPVHFKSLINGSNDDYQIKKITDYYFKRFDPIEISGNYVYQIIGEDKPQLLKQLGKYYQNDQNYETVIFRQRIKNKGADQNLDKLKKGFKLFKK